MVPGLFITIYMFFRKPRYDLLDVSDNKYRAKVELRKKDDAEWAKYKDRELI